MATLLKLLLKTQRYPLDIKIVYQCKNSNNNFIIFAFCLGILCTIPIFTVSNVVARVETDDCNSGSSTSKLAQYALELLTSTLGQLSSDTQSQGKLGLLVTVGIESDPITCMHSASVLIEQHNTDSKNCQHFMSSQGIYNLCACTLELSYSQGVFIGAHWTLNRCIATDSQAHWGSF